MAQYNDLFGFDRFMQAQNMGRQWDREREADEMRRMQYAQQMEGQRQQNALAQLQMQREGDTQNALRLGIENQPYLETLRSDPALYNEAQAVNRQDMLRYNPRADVGTVAKYGDRMEAADTSTKLPYTIGSQQKFYGAGGRQQFGTFAGMEGGKPKWVDVGDVPEEKKAVDDSKIQDTALKLNDRYVKQSGDFMLQRDAYSRVKSSAQDPSAAGDLALIFNYMKILDPGSTVREGEFANAANAGGVDQRVVSMYNKLMNGERLSPVMRNDFVSRAGKLYAGAENQHRRRTKSFEVMADKYKVPRDLVITDLGIYDDKDLVGGF